MTPSTPVNWRRSPRDATLRGPRRHPTGVTTAPNHDDDEVVRLVPPRPPARAVFRDLTALLLILTGFGIVGAFLYLLDPALVGVMFGTLVIVAGYRLAAKDR